MVGLRLRFKIRDPVNFKFNLGGVTPFLHADVQSSRARSTVPRARFLRGKIIVIDLLDKPYFL